MARVAMSTVTSSSRWSSLGRMAYRAEPSRLQACTNQLSSASTRVCWPSGETGILLYARPQSPIASALRELEPALKRAGHKPLVVDRPEALAPALQTGHYNVVMTDLAEVETVEKETRALATAPAILPVLYRPTSGVKKQAETEYGCFVQSPGKQVDVLAEIDGLLERRAKSGAVFVPAPKK